MKSRGIASDEYSEDAILFYAGMTRTNQENKKRSSAAAIDDNETDGNVKTKHMTNIESGVYLYEKRTDL